ncbi:MAG: penicillin-binding protein [Actinobacteria bacterium]|nr:penicillin-binding protein [Actinomycetota bacterium]
MRIFDGLAKLLVACVMAGVLVAGLLLPYTMGLGLTANKVTAAVETANTTLLDMSKLPLRTTITDDNGDPIAYIYDQNRTYVPLSQISLYLQRAVVSIEDRRFMVHGGVDWQGTLRALLNNSSGQPISGGSTITQQLVKNYLYLVEATTPAEKADAIARTPVRKLREAKMALQYETNHTKNEVLEQYLNLVAFGPSTYGAEAASEHFFGVHADKLSLSQAALLAAMINNPNQYNPLVGSQIIDTQNRRNLVLDDMFRDGYISAKERDKAKARSIAEDLNASVLPNGCIDAPGHATNGYFCRYVLDYLQNAGMGYEDIARGGYTIQTTLDPNVMKDAVAAVTKTVSPSDSAASRLANVMAVVEPGVGTRKVLALAANRPYGLDATKGETVQRLVTTFAPLGAGGVFKLFTAAAAMNKGLGVDSTISVPASYTSPLVPTYQFANTGKFPTTMTLGSALVQGADTPFVQLEDQVGLPAVVSTAVALGLRGYTLDAGDVDRAFAGIGATYQDLVTAQKIASFTLGVSPVSPLELSNVGATLDSDGMWCPPTPIASITDRTGKQVSWKQEPCAQAVPPELARTLTNSISAGTASPTGTGYAAAKAANWTRQTASMTGTTLQFKSGAFLGYTPYYSAAVMTWDYLSQPQSICVNPVRSCTVADAKKPGVGMAGGTIPEQTWLAAMGPMHAAEPVTPFPVSDPQYVAGQAGSQLPDVEGMLLADAQAQLKAHGFPNVTVTYDSTTTLPANTVVSQDPKQSALPGATISLTVSAGPGTPVGGAGGSGGTGTSGGPGTPGWSGGNDGGGGSGGTGGGNTGGG